MSKRSYNQNCVLARAGDVIGERWTLLLLRDLMVAPRRYGELLDSLKGIGTNLLAARLKELSGAGIVTRGEDAEGVTRYALTDSGRALEPTLLALIRWSMVHGPENRPGDHHLEDWDLLALKALFQPEAAGELSVVVQFETTGFQGWVRINQGEMEIGLGVEANRDVVIGGTVGDLFLGKKAPHELVTGGKAARLRPFMSVFSA